MLLCEHTREHPEDGTARLRQRLYLENNVLAIDECLWRNDGWELDTHVSIELPPELAKKLTEGT